MQLTRNRFGLSRKAVATGIAAALMISGVGALSAQAATKKPAKKPATKKAAPKPKPAVVCASAWAPGIPPPMAWPWRRPCAAPSTCRGRDPSRQLVSVSRFDPALMLPPDLRSAEAEALASRFDTALQALQAERPLPAGNQPGIIQGFAWRALACFNAGSGNPDGFTLQHEKRAGPGVDRADAPFKRLGRFGPMQAAIFLGQFRGIGHAGFRLGRGSWVFIQGAQDQPRARFGQRVMQIGRGGGRRDRHRFLQQHRPRIQPFFHAHDGDAGCGIARQNRCLNGPRPAPARQQ